MSKPRIPPLAQPRPAETEAMLASLMPPGMEPLKLFTTVARHPALLKLLADTGPVVYRSQHLTPQVRELVIQRVCARKGAEYEWGVHARIFGNKSGLSGERLRQLTFDREVGDVFDATERALIAAVDALCDTADMDDGQWQALRDASFDDAQVMEVIALAGLYHMIAFLVRALRIERETFAPTFDSVRPQGGARP